MLDQSGLTLRELMHNIPQLGPKVIDTLRQDPQKNRAAIAWEVVGAQALDGVLNVDVLEVLALAWCKAQELQKYADASKRPNGEPPDVYLGSHEFTKTVYPTLIITIKPFDPVRLRFTLDVSASIRAVRLWVGSGYITAIGTGDGAISAQLKYDTIDLKKVESQKVQFPGRHAFAPPGLRIGLGAGVQPPGSA